MSGESTAVRIIFAGTPAFAQVALKRLLESGHTITLVLSQPDRPGGRGMKLQASPVKQFALDHGIPVAQPRSLRLEGKYPDDAEAARMAIAQAQADVMVVAAYGLILPQWVLDDMGAAQATGTARLGCLNIHGSLLPRWRGAAPIHRAIEAGDTQTGITIMQMDAGLDTGDMLLAQSVPITAQATTAELHDELADLGAHLIVQALDLAAAGQLVPRGQPLLGITYAHKIEKHEAAIDWMQDASVIVQRVHAFNPFPGATATLQGELIKVWDALVANPALWAHAQDGVTPGQILGFAHDGIAVAAMNSIAILTQLQRPGGKRLAAADFLRGFDLQIGMKMDLHMNLHMDVGRSAPRPNQSTHETLV
jgi:methionyl-tRNA formyltransferase